MVKLTLQLPDDVYAPLVERAKKDGKTPEEVALDFVTTQVNEPEKDRLFALFGSIESDVADVPDRHDYYIGEALAHEMRNSD